MKWKTFPIADFAAFAADWDRLAERVAPRVPFLRSTFMRPLITHFATGAERIAAGYDGTELVAAAILHKVKPGIWETFQPSQLPLGPVLAPPLADIADLATQLMAVLPGVSVSLGLTQLDPLISTRPHEGDRLETLDYIQTAWVQVEGTFEAYWDGRGKNLRHNIRKQRSKLGEQGVTPRLETITSKDDVAGVLRDYGALESAGWKSSGGTAIHPDNAQGRFYKDMLEAYCAQGQGVMYRYWFNDKLVAVDLCVTGGETLVILKTTYDESIQGFSPAFLMRHEAFPALFAEGRIKRIEFYGKLMDWHKRWTDESRTLYHATLYRWKWLLKIKHARARRRQEAAAPAPETSEVASAQ